MIESDWGLVVTIFLLKLRNNILNESLRQFIITSSFKVDYCPESFPLTREFDDELEFVFNITLTISCL